MGGCSILQQCDAARRAWSAPAWASIRPSGKSQTHERTPGPHGVPESSLNRLPARALADDLDVESCLLAVDGDELVTRLERGQRHLARRRDDARHLDDL